MTTEISKNLKCILMRSGVQIWLEQDRIDNLEKVLLNLKESKFIKLDNQIINTADISGIYPASDMENMTRRKNGQWQDEEGIWRNRGEWRCDYGHWHTKGDFCKCVNSLGYRIK